LKSEGARSGLCGGEEERSFRVFIYNEHHYTTPLLRAPAHSQENVFFRGAAISSGTFKINYKNFRIFLLILTEVYEVLHNVLDTLVKLS
jgi:hypothetical protein